MNKNKAIAIFLILFSVLCSLSAVAASDLNSTDTIANDITEESITENADFDEEQENILDDGESGEWGTFSELRNILTTSGYQNVVLYKNYRCEGPKDAIVIDHTININLAVGTHTVTTVNPLNNESVSKTVKITTRITGNKNVNTYYGKNYAYKLRIIGDDGKPVGSNVAAKVTVNGKAQTLKTDKNGYITLKFTKNYLPKTYTVTAEYKGIKVTNKVKVKQILTLKKVKVKKSAKKLVLKATLKEGKKALKNKKVTFKFKGKKYKAKTNKKGIAKVPSKNQCLKNSKKAKK